jgi:hypothetical protein
MSCTINHSHVYGVEETEKTEIQRTRKFLGIFTVKSWEEVSSRTLWNDIHIKTDRPIRAVYLNNERILLGDSGGTNAK